MVLLWTIHELALASVPPPDRMEIPEPSGSWIWLLLICSLCAPVELLLPMEMLAQPATSQPEFTTPAVPTMLFSITPIHVPPLADFDTVIWLELAPAVTAGLTCTLLLRML